MGLEIHMDIEKVKCPVCQFPIAPEKKYTVIRGDGKAFHYHQECVPREVVEHLESHRARRKPWGGKRSIV